MKIRRETLLLIVVTIVVSVVHLKIFSFRITEDSPCWMAVAEYFLKGRGIDRLSPHCLFNPLIPFFSAVISALLSLQIREAYLMMNLGAFISSGILMFKIVEYFSNRRLGLIAAVLFLIDFQTQYYTFAVMPDIVTWLFMLLFIYVVVQIAKKSEVSYQRMVGLGLLGAAASLTKMNLAFLMPIVPILLAKYQKNAWIKKAGVFALSAATPTVVFYWWAAGKVGAYPWSSLIGGIERQSPSVQAHALSFIAAFLYTLPFTIIGLKHQPYKIKDGHVWFLITAGLLAPILIWPFVSLRFTYSLFVLLFPLAASGIMTTSSWLSKDSRAQRGIVAALLVGLFLLNTLRIHLTFVGATHFEFLRSVFFGQLL